MNGNCTRCAAPTDRLRILQEAMPPAGASTDKRWDLCPDCMAWFLAWVAP